MKKIVIGISLLATSLIAQGRLTAIGGANYSTIEYNNTAYDEAIMVDSRLGFFLGVESKPNPIVLGAAYAQYGADFSYTENTETIIGYDIYNYLVGYALYPFFHLSKFSAFGGIQAGLSLGGNTKGNVSDSRFSGHINADKFAFDYGAIAGVDMAISPTYGIRGFYYYGLADVMDLTTSDMNFKNRGIGVLLRVTP